MVQFFPRCSKRVRFIQFDYNAQISTNISTVSLVHEFTFDPTAVEKKLAADPKKDVHLAGPFPIHHFPLRISFYAKHNCSTHWSTRHACRMI